MEKGVLRDEEAEKQRNIDDEEFEAIFQFYIIKIIEIVHHLRVSCNTKSTAIVFFKKTVRKENVLEIDMRNYLIALVFLAAKCENVFLSLSHLSKTFTGVSEETILRYEWEIIKSLDYEINVGNIYAINLSRYIKILPKFSGDMKKAEEYWNIVDSYTNKVMCSRLDIKYSLGEIADLIEILSQWKIGYKVVFANDVLLSDYKSIRTYSDQEMRTTNEKIKSYRKTI